MEKMKNKLSLNETEKVTGGVIVRPDKCQHENTSQTGEKKVENGVVYVQLKCNACGERFWVKEAAAELSPAL